jgi:hypothetical protein
MKGTVASCTTQNKAVTAIKVHSRWQVRNTKVTGMLIAGYVPTLLACTEGSSKNEQWTVFYILGFQVTSCYSYSKIRYSETFGISVIRNFLGYRLGWNKLKQLMCVEARTGFAIRCIRRLREVLWRKAFMILSCELDHLTLRVLIPQVPIFFSASKVPRRNTSQSSDLDEYLDQPSIFLYPSTT